MKSKPPIHNGTATVLPTRRKITPPAYARELGVDVHRVLDWIRSGELPAIDVSTAPGRTRPRYRIDRSDIIAFERRRAVQPPAPRPSRRRRKDPQIIEFF